MRAVPRPKRLRKGDRDNFATLKRAFEHDDVALVSAVRKRDGKQVALVCAMRRNPEDQTITPVPFAVMVEGNPFKLFHDPTVE